MVDLRAIELASETVNDPVERALLRALKHARLDLEEVQRSIRDYTEHLTEFQEAKAMLDREIAVISDHLTTMRKGK